MKKLHKLYHGTSESIAKLACTKGLKLYNIELVENGFPRSICASNDKRICLTSIYPGFMAYNTVLNKEKWGIIEIEVEKLHPELFLPYEGYLLEKTKYKIVSEEDRLKKTFSFQQNLQNHQKKWKESIDQSGYLCYNRDIPVEAISRVVIYDPVSNWVMTRACVSVLNGIKYHKSNTRHEILTRWLIGDNINCEEWMGKEKYSKMIHSEKEKITQFLQNKHGLDVFYTISNGKKW